MLVDLNHQLYLGDTQQLLNSGIPEPELIISKAALDKDLNRKVWMVLGEGAVFMVILILGFLRVRKTISKELDLAGRQNNFLLSVTHELKSPIAAIQLQLQTLLSRDVDKPTQDKVLGAALKETSRLKLQVEDLLQVARLETGNDSLELEQVDLAKLVEETVKLKFISYLDQGRIDLDLEEGCNVKADSEGVVSILSNLTENAIKYSGDDSRIRISMMSNAQKVNLVVADNGPGISASEKQKVFDRFYRSGNENTRGAKGTGLGLYIVKQLAEGMNADLVLTDNQPTGSVFTITFHN